MAKFVIALFEIYGGTDVQISKQTNILQYQVQRLATRKVVYIDSAFFRGILRYLTQSKLLLKKSL